MKWFLPIMIAILAVFANGNGIAQVSSTPPCRAGTLDLRAIKDNNSAGSAYGPTGTQIACLSGPTLSPIDLGQRWYSSWAVFGENDIEGSWDVWGAGSPNSLYDVSNNYWGGGAISASQIVVSDVYLGAAPTPPSVYCSGDLDDKSKKKDQSKTQSIQTGSSSCDNLYSKGMGLITDAAYLEAQDTLEDFINRCYSLSAAYQAFGNIATSVSGDGISGDAKWLTLRNWLFSVLYLNPDSNYYCGDAGALLSTFDYGSGSRGNDLRGRVAVEKFLTQCGKCSYYTSTVPQSLPTLWRQIYKLWQDTVTDSLLTPFDSSVPTLQQIGFQLLLGPQYAAVNDGVIPSSILGAIGISPNPFMDNTVIDYTINVPATLTVEVYDQLGHRVTSPVPSVFTNNGEYSFTLSGSDIPSGNYYIRFSVPEGEVKTIKVVKE
jgi:hypothetical protein